MNTIWLSFVLLLVPAFPGASHPQAAHTLRLETGRPFDAALPRDFYLQGNAIPTEKRNAALVITPSGKQLLFALLDTSGYSSQIQQKYIGMIIAEGRASVGTASLKVGSYGFGLTTKEDKTYFNIYDQAGTKMASCLMKNDAQLKVPRPLQVVLARDGTARLYIGREWVQIR